MNVIENARSTTDTKVRVPDINPISGMCPICVDDCNVLCEVAKSCFRGREVLYPSTEYFGRSTASSNKDFFIDWSHFQIMSELLTAKGIPEDSDLAFFENADITTVVGSSSKRPIRMSMPVHLAGLGSTAIAKNYWAELASGAAMTGVCQVIGENVCGMDSNAVYSNGKVQDSPDLKHRVDSYNDFWDGKNGRIVLQTNIEDARGGADDYAVSKLGVDVVERKWGQGAKAIGGEVRVGDLAKAIDLKKRGYLVLPDPEDPDVQKAFKDGAFRSFERHSRVGFPKYDGFLEDVDELRSKGVKNVFLKTGAFKPEVVAFTMKCASDAKLDLVTFDGAGAGTGMSPVPMMNEMSTPGIYLFSQVIQCAKLLKEQGRFVPDVSFAGGFVNETQIYKALALSDLGDGPIVKSIGMARTPLLAAMKGRNFTDLAAEGKLPPKFARQYGENPEQFFISAPEIAKRFPGKKLGKDIPWGGVGLYTYWHGRIGEGLKQLMAGTRKFKLPCIERGDLVSLTKRAHEATGVETLEMRAARVIKEIL
ncbi:MAG: FMN-binding glutamate synthase family protein [Thermoplasmatales archaeon]|nr:FMN-binding glutamate synthase family protein [Thermoplasmatales archaeon]